MWMWMNKLLRRGRRPASKDAAPTEQTAGEAAGEDTTAAVTLAQAQAKETEIASRLAILDARLALVKKEAKD